MEVASLFLTILADDFLHDQQRVKLLYLYLTAYDFGRVSIVASFLLRVVLAIYSR